MPLLSRRSCLARAGGGAGLLALTTLLERAGLLAPAAEAAGVTSARGTAPHHRPRARSVIWLFMYGGPSAMDTFDPKPALDRAHGKRFGGKVALFAGKPGPLMRSPFAFRQHGESGAWVSEIFPALAGQVDRLAFLRSCFVETNTHDLALFQMNTGLARLGFPSAGSWVSYGLGSESQDLPGFVVMYDPRGGPVGGPPLWSSGFLPGAHQGTLFRAGERPILNLARPEGVSARSQRQQLDLLGRLNRDHAARNPAEAQLEARIASFELAYRMQVAAPEAVDVGRESEATRRLYGLDRSPSRAFGTQLLMARRLVERGVRFVQIYSGGTDCEWDAHGKLAENHRARAAETDVPIAGLLADLAQRGLLDDTLVIWGGEFGRLPMSEGTSAGRDHNPHGFLTWMAGGGIRGGTSHGATDELGHQAVQDPVSVHDLHATVLHLLGLDHTRLTYFHNGRRFRLTDVAGQVIAPIVT